MSASQGSLFSQTLKDITDTKLADLAQYRTAFEARRSAVLTDLEQEKDVVRALEVLADGVKKCFALGTVDGRVQRGTSDYPRLEVDLQNLDRFLAQARYDPSVSHQILERWHQTLVKQLDVQSLKYSFASLYGQLTTEWLTQKTSALPAPTGDDDASQDFERIDSARKMASRASWERSAFEPADVDPEAITAMLQNLFEPEGDQHVALRRELGVLRKLVTDFENNLASPGSFTPDALNWTIEGLLTSDLLTDEKRTVLRDFLTNPNVLKEIGDVLNMRMAALSSWSWGSEVPLEQRREVNGTFRVFMHEDLLQAIFLQYIGVKWSVFWKRTLNLLQRIPMWKSALPRLSTKEHDRLEAQLGRAFITDSIQGYRESLYSSCFFLAQLRDSERSGLVAKEGEQLASFSFDSVPTAQAPPMSIQSHQQQHFGTQYYRQDAPVPRKATRSAARSGPPPPAARKQVSSTTGFELQKNAAEKTPIRLRQDLLHLLASDVQVKARCHGEITCFRSEIESFYQSLPHATIERVLSFFGVSRRWVDFFLKFLQAPLRFIEDADSEPRIRRRGAPGAHAISEVLGELVLFCLDFQVNQAANGEILWRVQDDLWFWSSKHDACCRAWSSIQSFAKTAGLTISQQRTGCVRMSRSLDPESGKIKFSALQPDSALPGGDLRWGMLMLNPESGRWEIDQEMVDKHISELSRQLQDKSDSLFSWIQALNTYASTFFNTNFGPPADCLGRQHVDSMLETHRRIQRKIFAANDGHPEYGSVTEYIKRTVAQRFGIADIPDAFIFLPTELGGLEVHNPFIGLLQIRDKLPKDPEQAFVKFEEAERLQYNQRRVAYEDKLEGAKAGYPQVIIDKEPFMSFEEYKSYRETLVYFHADELVDVWQELVKRPVEESVDCDRTSDIAAALRALGSQQTSGILPEWDNMEPYWKWVAQLYGPEMIDQFGGFRAVDPGWLPMGMVSQFRSGRVKWQD